LDAIPNERERRKIGMDGVEEKKGRKREKKEL
jgi:hypothetical protein